MSQVQKRDPELKKENRWTPRFFLTRSSTHPGSDLRAADVTLGAPDAREKKGLQVSQSRGHDTEQYGEQ